MVNGDTFINDYPCPWHPWPTGYPQTYVLLAIKSSNQELCQVATKGTRCPRSPTKLSVLVGKGGRAGQQPEVGTECVVQECSLRSGSGQWCGGQEGLLWFLE